MTLLHYVISQGFPFDAVVHVNTLTGVCENGRYLTTDFVHEMCAKWDVPLIEMRPPKTFEEVFIDEPVIDGLPGPGMHFIAYNRLKERPVRTLVRQSKEHARDRIMLVTGIRADESRIRMGYGDTIIDRMGAQVWVNLIYRWTNEEMHAYRKEHGIPQNPVAEHIHISGECLCGSFSRPGELEEIEFFFPDTGRRIREWERRAQEKGLTYCQWGQRRGGKDDPGKVGMCQQCVGQMEFNPEATVEIGGSA